MLNIDGFAYTNRLRKAHPAEKTVFALVTMLVCLGFSSISLSCLVILLMAAATVRRAGIPGRVYLKLLFLPFSFLVIGVSAIGVTVTANGADPCWLTGVTVLGITVGVTKSSLLLAARLFCKSLGAVSCLYFLALTTPVVELIQVMRKAGFPALFIELTELMYRFIFVTAETADKIYTSQSARQGYASVKNSLKSLSELTAALFVRTYERSRMLFTTLSARGYTGQLNVLAPQYKISLTNVFLIIGIETALITAGLILEVGGVG